MIDIILAIKRNKFLYNIFLWIKLFLYFIYYSIFLHIFRIFKVNSKKIIFINYTGNGYGDMGKYICNELLNQDYKIYWATEKKYKDSLPQRVNYVKFNSIQYLFHLCTSKIWINNCRFRFGTVKRKNQFYIQTWHGCIGYKKVELDAGKSLTKQYILGAKRDSKMADLFISNSTFCTNNYRDNFWYDGKILECGCPRNDIIVNNNLSVIEKVKNHFNISDNSKICLYAPTFRATNSLSAYNIKYDLLLKQLENKFGGEWKLLIRLHPNVSYLADRISGVGQNIINATNYPDMQELLVAADFMITDYSSCIFDYAISKKPAIIYASDIEDYTRERDFSFDIKDTPFYIAENNDELLKGIKNFDFDDYKIKVDKFYKKMGLKENGNSCKEISKMIDEITSNKGDFKNEAFK